MISLISFPCMKSVSAALENFQGIKKKTEKHKTKQSKAEKDKQDKNKAKSKCANQRIQSLKAYAL